MESGTQKLSHFLTEFRHCRECDENNPVCWGFDIPVRWRNNTTAFIIYKNQCTAARRSVSNIPKLPPVPHPQDPCLVRPRSSFIFSWWLQIPWWGRLHLEFVVPFGGDDKLRVRKAATLRSKMRRPSWEASQRRKFIRATRLGQSRRERRRGWGVGAPLSPTHHLVLD